MGLWQRLLATAGRRHQCLWMLLNQYRTINLYEILYFLQNRVSHDSLILHAQTNTKDVCYLDVSIPPTLSFQYVRFQLSFSARRKETVHHKWCAIWNWLQTCCSCCCRFVVSRLLRVYDGWQLTCFWCWNLPRRLLRVTSVKGCLNTYC